MHISVRAVWGWSVFLVACLVGCTSNTGPSDAGTAGPGSSSAASSSSAQGSSTSGTWSSSPQASSAAPSSSSSPASGPVAAYGFAQGSGNVLADATGHGHHGTLVGGPQWSTGRNGGGLTFSGGAGHVTMADVNELDGLTSLTVMAWVRTTASGERHVVDKSQCDGAANGGPFELGTGFFTAGKATMLIYTGAGTPAFHKVESAASITDGNWHHVAGTYDGTQLRIFVDGTQDGATPVSGVTLSSNSNSLELGGHCNGHAYHWDGSVDDVRLYNRALDATQIQADMASAVVETVTDGGVPTTDAGARVDAGVPPGAFFIDFSTAAIEDPLSAGGVFTNNTQGTGGNVAPGNLTSMRVGLASDGVTRIALENHGGIEYDDSFAFVPGFPGDQFAEAAIYKEPGYDVNASGSNHELELILGCSSAAGVRTWNEFLFNSGGGMDILYLSGGPSDFTSISNAGSPTVVPSDGDVVRAERVGNTLSLYVNGQLQIQYLGTDSAHVAQGNGVGIAGFIRPGATHNKYGFRSLTVGNL